MKVMLTCRIDEDLMERMKATGEGRSSLTVKALEQYLCRRNGAKNAIRGKAAVAMKAAKAEELRRAMEKSRSVPPSKGKDSAAVLAVGGRKNGVVAVSAKAGGACPNCGKGLVPWGAMMRCQDCKRNFAK